MEWSSENSCPALRTHETNLLISHCFLAVGKKVEECVYHLHHHEIASRLVVKKYLTCKGKESAATWPIVFPYCLHKMPGNLTDGENSIAQ